MFGGEGVPVSQLESYITHLPKESATVQALLGAEPGEWTTTEQLLALLLEASDVGHRVLVKLLSQKPPKMGDPLRIEWPGRKKAEALKKSRRPPSTPVEVMAFLGRRNSKVKVVPKGDET